MLFFPKQIVKLKEACNEQLFEHTEVNLKKHHTNKNKER